MQSHMISHRLTILNSLPLRPPNMRFQAWQVAFVVVLWVTSPIGDTKEVLLTFNNGGGWSSPGGATLIGVLTACSGLLGYDSTVHMSMSRHL